MYNNPIPPVDTAKIVFTNLYKCRVPNLQTMSEDYIRIFGIPTTGDPGIDRELANEWITTMLTIAAMVDYHKQGVNIKVVKYEDVKEIYSHISNHLLAWKNQLENGLNIGDAPIEDLVAMDEFANTVYSHAKYQFTREMADSILTRHMTGILRFNSLNFLKPMDKTSNDLPEGTTSTEDIDPYPKRQSLSDIFKDRKIGRKWN